MQRTKSDAGEIETDELLTAAEALEIYDVLENVTLKVETETGDELGVEETDIDDEMKMRLLHGISVFVEFKIKALAVVTADDEAFGLVDKMRLKASWRTS